MKAHLISKLFLKRIGDGKNIGYFNILDSTSGIMSIGSGNPELVIEDLHDNILILDENEEEINLEKARSDLENKFAKGIDKIIKCKTDKPLILKEMKWDIIKYFIAQAFMTESNLKNNEDLIKKYFAGLEDRIEIIEKEFGKHQLYDSGIKEVNGKFKDLVNDTGTYFDKAVLIKKNFYQ